MDDDLRQRHLRLLGRAKGGQNPIADGLEVVQGEGLRQRGGHDASVTVHGEAAGWQMNQPRIGRLKKTTQEAHLVRMVLKESRICSAASAGGKPTHSLVLPQGATATLRCGPVPRICCSSPTW